ncbi:uncharacterized protein LOC123526189 [Mercenaria mercenaria]|uniref:uncharacterized protein LOC123526189 n=1 Tax=Mercenaria mercenaria TaxID=6596 RepID=UPI00234E5175|nr:uncharacterized protein LOC123526189 [Mercenaria mercenaria]
MKHNYNLHQKRKAIAREEKDRDKQESKHQPKLHVCAFDLQAVLYTPCSLVSVMYYMRKLCVYNLSVYSLKNGDGSCYLWTETNGMRGSSEIATCLRLYLLALPTQVEHVILYSDACTGQNRNQIMASALLHFVTHNRNIKTIDHKFLESGHTQNECDSVHSAVEFAKKKTKIYVPSQWDTVITMARRRDPYHVVPLRYSDFLDYKDVKKNQIKVQTNARVKVSWIQIRHMRFVKDLPDTMLFKNDLRDDFTAIKIARDVKLNEVVPNKYRQKLPVSAAKKKDLMTLCKNGAIPKDS